MNANSLLLIKLLSDIAITALSTIKQVDSMTPEQIDEALVKAEAVSQTLLNELNDH